MSNIEKLTLSVQEAAELSGFGRDTLYNLCHIDGFPAIWITERRVRIHREKFIDWIDNHPGVNGSFVLGGTSAPTRP